MGQKMLLYSAFARKVEHKWLVRVIRSTLLSGYLETHGQLIDLANEQNFPSSAQLAILLHAGVCLLFAPTF